MRGPSWARSSPLRRTPLTARQRQLLDGWIRMLDIDLERAQQVLRLPPTRWPVPPIALPAVLDWSGRELVPAVDAPDDDEAAAEAARPVEPTVPLRGAYARRAARKGGSR